MRHGIIFVLLVGFASAASAAADLGRAPGSIVKTAAHVLANPAFDREGGETVATAVPIPSLPYVDSGATCDNVNDYDIP